MPIVLVPLATLVAVLWLLAIASTIAVIMGYVSGALSGLPWPIDKLSGPVSSLGSIINRAAAKLYGGLDSIIGGAWHWMARYLDKTFQQIEAQAHLAWTQAEILAGHVYDVTGLRQAVHSLTDTFRGIEHGIKDLRKLWHGIEARVKQLEHDLMKGIGHDLRLEVKALERDFGKVEHKVLPALRGEVAAAENEVTALKSWITKNVPLAGTATFAGVVAAALGSLGLGWLRCNSNPFNNSKNACGLWSILGKVLSLAGLLVVAFDFPEFVSAAEFVAGAIGDAVGSIEGTFSLELPPLPPPKT